MDRQGASWRLRARRAELGLSEDALAGAMRRWAEIRGEPRPDITGEAVAEWEGGTRALDPPTLRLLWLALEAPEWEPAVDTWSLFRPERPAAGHGQRRRDLVRTLAELGAPTGLDPERLSRTLEESLRVDRALVEGLTFVARRFPKEWGRQPPQALRRHVHGHLQVVQALLDGPMPGDSRRQLQSAAATSATLAGLISLLVELYEDSAIYLKIGARLAESAGDAEVRGLALMFASYLSSAIEPDAQWPNPPLARAQIEAAGQLVSPGAAPLARAWVLLRAAQEHAWAGDELGAYRLLDTAEGLCVVGRVPADGLVSPWNEDAHLTFQAEVAAMCGRTEEAIFLFEEGLLALGADGVARRPRALSDLAAAHARHGEVDRACELLIEAHELARRAGLSDRIPRVVAVRNRYLAHYAAEPAVRRLDDLVRSR